MQKFEENIAHRLTARHKKCFQFCGDLRGKDILDIGCSFGWFEKMALEAGCKSVLGIEPKEKDFYLARQEAPNALLKVGSAIDIPCASETFDLAVMFDVLEHLPKNSEPIAFREIKRVLRPGGIMVVSTPFHFWLSNITDPAWWLIGHRHYKAEKLAKMLADSGFAVESAERRGRIFELISILLLYFFKWVLRREMPFKNWFEKKRISEYLTDKDGFETLYVRAVKII